MLVYLTVAIATGLFALLLTPLAARLAARLGIVDHPGVRKVHGDAVAYLGGAAVLGAMLLGFGALMLMARDPLASWERLDPRMLAIVGGALLLFGVGLKDDIGYVRGRWKLLAQVGAAALVWVAGVRIEHLHLFDGLTIDFGAFGLVITLLWIVGITNAINFIDGLDGLAASLGAIGCAAIGYVAFCSGHYPAAVMMAALFGALVGFLPFNAHPARIFLGDSGSLMIGFLLSSTSIYATAKSATFVGLAIPVIALGIPILDTLLSMLRRVIERRSIFSPDKHHIHHRLLALGYGQRRVVYLLCGETAFATVLGILLLEASNPVRVLAFAGILGLHFLLFRWVGAVRLGDSLRIFRQFAANANTTNTERREFDDLQLHFRESQSIAEWWLALSKAAERLRFARLTMDVERRDGSMAALAWAPREVPSHGLPMLGAKVPVRHRRAAKPLNLEVEVVQGESLESAGRRLALFGRLLDQHSIAELPMRPRSGSFRRPTLGRPSPRHDQAGEVSGVT